MALRVDRYGNIVGTITPRDVEYELTSLLRLPQYGVKWKRLRDMPQRWRHACVDVGVEEYSEPKVFLFADGSKVYYIHCPYCNTIIYILENIQKANLGGVYGRL